MTSAAAVAAVAYLATGLLATTTADRLVTIGVAAIGACASLAAAVISRGNRQEIRGRRVVVTKSDDETVIRNEDLKELEDPHGRAQ